MKKRWYVTMTWHGWPEGGSFGTVVWANDREHAEELCREEMALAICEGVNDPESQVSWWLENYGKDWYVVDCFDLEEFITRYTSLKPPSVITNYKTKGREWR